MAALALAEAASPRLQRARGVGRLVAVPREGRTAIASLFQEGCAKIRLPHTHTDVLEAVLMNTAGGLTGGDDIAWSITAEPGTKLVVTTPACERVYRSLGGPARIVNRIAVGAGAQCDWLPQETILYEASALDRHLDVDLAADAAFTAVETVLLGRQAMGEAALGATLSDRWTIRREGRLIHAEATRLTGTAAERNGMALLAGAAAFATLVHVGPTAERRLDAVRALLPPTGGASLAGERLTVRLVAESGLALRRSLTPIIAVLSSAGTVPRLWSL